MTEEEVMFVFALHHCFSVGPTIGIWEIKIILLVILSHTCLFRAIDVPPYLWHPKQPHSFLITLLRGSTETTLKLSSIYSPKIGPDNTASQWKLYFHKGL